MIKKLSRVLCTVLAIAAIISIQISPTAAASAGFTDVPTNAWFAGAVTAAVNKGYVKGMGDGRFAPYDNLTYAHVFSMLVNAQYEYDERVYESNNVHVVDNKYNSKTPWWGYYANFLDDKGILAGTKVNNNVTSTGAVESTINRYEMVQIVYNVLKANDFSKDASKQSSITDWANVPSKYQDAVVTGYSLGILSGFEDGSFGGTGILTRAQACVIFNKMLDVLAKGTGGGTTNPPSEKNIIVSTKETDKGTGYYVGDNQFETGYLNNGKPITEENVIELLAKAKTIWPADTSWGNSGDSNNHWYENTDLNTQVKSFIRTIYNNDTSYACGGFAAMISDYLFGKYNNPMRRLDDVSKTRPGDIVIRLKDTGRVDHIMVATSAPDSNGYIYYTEGNYGSAVHWGNVFREASIVSQGKSLVVYTRYPD